MARGEIMSEVDWYLMPTNRPREDQWARAARMTPRLSPSAFSELPATFARELEQLGGGRIGFSRGIRTRNTYHVYPHEDSAGVDREVALEHDGIDDAFEGKASVVRFCRGGTWISFSGAD